MLNQLVYGWWKGTFALWRHLSKKLGKTYLIPFPAALSLSHGSSEFQLCPSLPVQDNNVLCIFPSCWVLHCPSVIWGRREQGRCWQYRNSWRTLTTSYWEAEGKMKILMECRMKAPASWCEENGNFMQACCALKTTPGQQQGSGGENNICAERWWCCAWCSGYIQLIHLIPHNCGMLRDITSANRTSINPKEESPSLGGLNVSGTVVQIVAVGTGRVG